MTKSIVLKELMLALFPLEDSSESLNAPARLLAADGEIDTPDPSPLATEARLLEGKEFMLLLVGGDDDEDRRWFMQEPLRRFPMDNDQSRDLQEKLQGRREETSYVAMAIMYVLRPSS